MIGCITAVFVLIALPVTPFVAGLGRGRWGKIVRHPIDSIFRGFHLLGLGMMKVYIGLEPLTDTEHKATIWAIPMVWGFALWLNFRSS